LANVLAFIELDGGRPTAASLAGLGLGRRIGSAWGATVYALLPCAEAPRYQADDVIAEVARHGADKALLVVAPALAGPPLFATHGPTVVAACTRLPPAIVLFPSSSAGMDLAPRVAAHLGAALAIRPRLVIEGKCATLVRPAGAGQLRRIDLGELDRPVVVTCADVDARATATRGEIEVIVLAPPTHDPRVAVLPGESPRAPRRAQAPLTFLCGEALDPTAQAALAPKLERAGMRLARAGAPRGPNELVIALAPTEQPDPHATADLAIAGNPEQLLREIVATIEAT
jgi:electron transfer flavoprotein alpha subunit